MADYNMNINCMNIWISRFVTCSRETSTESINCTWRMDDLIDMTQIDGRLRMTNSKLADTDGTRNQNCQI